MKKLTPKWPSLLSATSHVAAKGYSLAVPMCHTLKSEIWVDICSFSLFVLWYNYYVLVSVCKRCTRRCDCCNPELVCDSQQVQLQILKKQCVFSLYSHNPRDDHMECTWNLGFLNEEHSRVSKIKPGEKKSGFYIQAVIWIFILFMLSFENYLYHLIKKPLSLFKQHTLVTFVQGTSFLVSKLALQAAH